jgi:drug/metabolite transporter (DMT)-like permease
LLFPIVILTEGKVLPTTLVAWGGILGLGIVSEGFGQRLLANSMGKFSSSFVALFLLLEPILSGILACWIFGETITSTTWVGFAVVLWGIYLAQSSGCALQQSKESQKTTVDPGETITTPIWEGVRFR